MLTSLRDGYCAVILGSSGGIGQALCDLFRCDPRCETLLGYSTRTNPAIDLSHEETIENAARDASTKIEVIDVLIVATGILQAPNGTPPEKAFSQLDADLCREIFQINTIGPAIALKHFIPLLNRRGRTLIATLSARVGSIGDNGLGGWISYRASKAALNQITHTAAIELSRKNKHSVCVALHPGTIETELSKPLARGRFTHSAEDCASNLLGVLDKLSPDETGGFFDYAGKSIPW